MYKLTLILFLLSLSACTHNNQHEFKPQAIPDNTQSVIYIFRPDALANRFTTPDILLNDSPQFKLKNNYYDYLLVNKGHHQLQLELPQRFTGKQHIELEVEAAQHYFIQLTTSTQFQMNQPYTRRFDLQLVPEQLALPQIRQLKANKEQISRPAPATAATPSETKQHHFSISKTRDPFSPPAD